MNLRILLLAALAGWPGLAPAEDATRPLARGEAPAIPQDTTSGVALAPAPDGLTPMDVEAFRAAIAACWAADPGAPVVTMAFSLTPEGMVDGEIRRVLGAGMPATGFPVDDAAAAARRAILRCQPYDLPADAYPQWQSVELTFNPAGMSSP